MEKVVYALKCITDGSWLSENNDWFYNKKYRTEFSTKLEALGCIEKNDYDLSEISIVKITKKKFNQRIDELSEKLNLVSSKIADIENDLSKIKELKKSEPSQSLTSRKVITQFFQEGDVWRWTSEREAKEYGAKVGTYVFVGKQDSLYIKRFLVRYGRKEDSWLEHLTDGLKLVERNGELVNE